VTLPTLTKNVILLTVDALRADHLTCYGYERDTSPEIESLVEEGKHYEWAFSASSHTREAVPALLTGKYPQDATGPDFTLDAKPVSKRLDATHATAAFHSNPYISRAYGFGAGFDRFDDDLYLGENRILALAQRAIDKYLLNRGKYHARAEQINKKSLNWVDALSEDQSFFLWNHYMDPHGPYNPPSEYSFADTTVSDNEAQKLYQRLCDGDGSADDQELATDLYDGEIRYLDDYIGRFVESLRKLGHLEDTLLILTADHGDLFGEYGKYGHPRYVYPELTRIPMILAGSLTDSLTPDRTASTVDVVPTILAAAEVSSTSILPGTSLLNSGFPDEPVFSSATTQGANNGLRRFAAWCGPEGYRMTRTTDGGKIVDESVSNPGGAENESMGRRKLRPQLEDFSETRLDGVAESGGDSRNQVEERLEALGYK